jgi:hypothetical protein
MVDATPISPDVMSVLEDPILWERITDIELSKFIEGERKSKKAIFLSLCYIWVEGSEVPINTFVSSESTAGKSFVCRQIVNLFPLNLVEYRTKITPEAFTYWHNKDDEWDWNGKICYLEDVSQALLDSSTFRVMCSEGSKATVVIKQRAVDIDIPGKPAMLITSATTNPKAEVLNRFQIISLDETSKQTKDITFRQAINAEGGESEDYDPIIQKALGYLSRKRVIVPYARRIHYHLTKSYHYKNIRLRRDFSRLLDLIKSSAALHQYQRDENEKGEIEASERDYEIAREAINYIQTQTFRGLTHRLKKAFDYCKQMEEFTAKDIHSKYPFVNQKMWYIYLDKLLERNMLTTTLKKTDDAKQRVTFYQVSESSGFELPEFSKLPRTITNVTLDTKHTIDTKVTNDGNNSNNCNNFIKNLQDNAERFRAYLSEWKQSGGDRRDVDQVIKDIGQSGYDFFMNYGLLFEPTPGKVMPI